MQLAAVIFVLWLSTQSSILGFEADVSSPLCATTSNLTNCTLDRSDDDTNSSSLMCNAGMKLSENNLTYCQPLSDISNASQTDLEEANSDKLNFTTTPSYEYDTDQQYKADLSDNDISTEEGQSGQLITSKEYNSSQSSFSGNISIDYEIISILENILPAILDGIQEENRVEITTHYYNNTDKINNSSYAEDNPLIKPTEIGEPVIHDFTDSLVGHESNNNTTENPTLSTELGTDDSMTESSFWYKLFHWPSLKTKKDLEKIKRKKREDNQHRIDSEEYQDLENDRAAGDTADSSISEEMVTQRSNSTENCDSGECISSKEVVDSALPSNYDIKITEIRNEIVILQNEILEGDPGETSHSCSLE